ncbi:hypothetical protein Phum_PHUM530350 [Pediculus humanus corporis]|uniref:Uncharacterized protein n=1 Tax=Pediculus humanus subsp. corporis TaxID=121224 RepID=E0VZD4_PEDHC|nr:uncharacterized protein Phum_PHUM530350 [Pediculus humanus corporis]EEB18740.1 hypothetical protein Phum_PHUM530350 [Pediculus humanus corporis]
MDRTKIKFARAIFFKELTESEDDIEKADDPEQDGNIYHNKTLYKTKAITEDDVQNTEKLDKNLNKSDGDDNDVDNDCIVQCLYYTIQCCECIIS